MPTRLWIVEDESIVAMDIRDTLRHLGYEVAGVASSGEEAIAKVAEARPDLVLMDIKLRGDMDGIEAANRIRARFDLPVVYLTAYTDEQSLQRAKISEPFGYVLKPFEEKELRTVIEIALYKHRTEASLRARERWLTTTLGSITDAVVSADTQGRVTYMNPSAETLTGWTHELACGKDITEVLQLLDPDGRNMVPLGVSAALERGTVVTLTDKLLSGQDGRRTPVDQSIAPIKDDDGCVAGLVLVLQDVSLRKKAEQERESWETESRRVERLESLELLAGGLAHDFNNMLTVILGNAQLGLQQVAPWAPSYNELSAIEKACRQTSPLVSQLLAFSRHRVLEPRVLDLNGLIGESARLLGHMASEKIELRVQLTPNLKAVLADPDSMLQVVMSLAARARKVMPDGGVLTIHTGMARLDDEYVRTHPEAKAGEYVRLTVSDTGVTLNNAARAHLFEPFFATKEIGEATGLGLAAVYGIVRQHGGVIDVKSGASQGTVFEICVPAYSAPAGKTAEVLDNTVPTGKETILLAEDEDLVQRCVQAMLERLGYNVLLAKDGREAVASYSANKSRVDMVILDAVMPGLTGHEAYEEMERLGLAVPVLFVTGYGGNMAHLPSAKTPTRVLHKPFTLDQLGRQVKELFDLRVAKGRTAVRLPVEPCATAAPAAFRPAGTPVPDGRNAC